MLVNKLCEKHDSHKVPVYNTHLFRSLDFCVEPRTSIDKQRLEAAQMQFLKPLLGYTKLDR
jgi:hypothetical protein